MSLSKRAPEHADHRGALEQDQVDGQFRNAAAGEADDQQAAVPGDAADGLVEKVAADRVVDHVGAVAIGEAFDFVLEAGFAVVDQFVRACVSGDFEFLGAAGGGDDAGAEGFADFYGGQADAAGCTEHQQGFAGLQAGALCEGVHGGAVGHAECGRRGEVHALWNRQHVVVGHGDLLGKAAPASEGHDAVAGFQMADVFPDGGYHACGLTPR